MRFLKYYGDILKINIDSLINVYADFKNLEIIDSRNNLRAIKERINNCYFICKNELIYIVLKLYLFLLDGREAGVQPVCLCILRSLLIIMSIMVKKF